MDKTLIITENSRQSSFATNQRLLSQLTQIRESAEVTAKKLHDSETILKQKCDVISQRVQEISVLTQKITNIEAQMAKTKSEAEKKETEKRLIFVLAVFFFVLPIIWRFRS